MTRTRGVLVALVLSLLGVVAVGVPVASAQDRPVGVADVRAHKLVLLNADGTATVTADVRCQPGWESGELSVRVTQADGSYGDGFTIVSVACDGAWHESTVVVGDTFGSLYRGRATVSAQFLVTNVDSGDSAGAHATVKGRVRLA